MRKQKNKGITLIALVITIIVLLILAGVAIATLTGDNGVLTKASSSKIKNEQAIVKEQIILAYGEYQVDTQTSSNTKLANINNNLKLASEGFGRVRATRADDYKNKKENFYRILRKRQTSYKLRWNSRCKKVDRKQNDIRKWNKWKK